MKQWGIISFVAVEIATIIEYWAIINSEHWTLTPAFQGSGHWPSLKMAIHNGHFFFSQLGLPS